MLFSFFQGYNKAKKFIASQGKYYKYKLLKLMCQQLLTEFLGNECHAFAKSDTRTFHLRTYFMHRSIGKETSEQNILSYHRECSETHVYRNPNKATTTKYIPLCS